MSLWVPFLTAFALGPARVCQDYQQHAPKRRWRLPQQADPLDYAEDKAQGEGIWRRNYASLAGLSGKVLEVLHDQASKGQVLVCTEEKAKGALPVLTIASHAAQKKVKPNGVVSARVLFDGSNGTEVNSRTRVRDQERALVAADLRRCVRRRKEASARLH